MFKASTHNEFAVEMQRAPIGSRSVSVPGGNLYPTYVKTAPNRWERTGLVFGMDTRTDPTVANVEGWSYDVRTLHYPTTEQEAPMPEPRVIQCDGMSTSDFHEALIQAPVGTVATSTTPAYYFTKISENQWQPNTPGPGVNLRSNESDAWTPNGRTLRWPESHVPPANTELDVVKRQLDDLKRRVVDVAREAAEKHGWCGVVDELLVELGLIKPRLVRYTIRVEAEPTDNDWGDIAAWVADALHDQGGMKVTNVIVQDALVLDDQA